MKRKNGEGSWGKKTINGIEYKRFTIKYDFLDKPKDFYGKTEKEINEKRKKFEQQQKNYGNLKKDYGKQTLGNYLENYLKTELKRTLTPNGYDSYETIIRTQVKNLKEYDLYNKQLLQINKEICENYVNALVIHGYSLKTIKKVCGLISQCLNYAVEHERILKNYMPLVKMPNEDVVLKKKKIHNFFSKEQMSLFCEQAMHIESKEERYNNSQRIGEYTYGYNGLALAFIGQTGLRVGELIGLTWDCINYNKQLISVYNSESLVIKRNKDGTPITYINDQGIKCKEKRRNRKGTKTQAGMRYVPITLLANKILKYMEQFKKNDKDVIFINKNGRHQNKDRLLRTLHAICKRSNLPILATHELRHSYGSIILHQEHVDIQVVSRLLGHKDISTTYNIYAHVLDEIMAESVKIFDEI